MVLVLPVCQVALACGRLGEVGGLYQAVKALRRHGWPLQAQGSRAVVRVWGMAACLLHEDEEALGALWDEAGRRDELMWQAEEQAAR